MCDVSPKPARGFAACRPRWGVLYALTMPQLLVLAVVEASQASHPLRTALRCAVALGTFVAMAAWMRLNRTALDLQNWCDCAAERMTVRVIASRRPPAAEPLESRAPAPESEEVLV